ncbi:MAG: sulfatase-like hydrolase/transferase [Candidatus Methylomirabilales bacterium]
MYFKTFTLSVVLLSIVGVGVLRGSTATAQPIRYDAEHYVLLHQYAEKWAAEDKELDKRLADIRKKNGGKRPNIVYILIDDMGFGEFGIPALNKIRGGRTPNIDELAAQGMMFTRFYAENICTSTRVAFMTGRLAVRTGMELTKVTPPEGVGFNDREVTIAELLSDAGYQTHHIGKWHMGDIKEAYPTNQGFDYASFPMHNQVAYSFLTRDAELEARTAAFTPKSVDSDYGLDKTFRLYDWVTQVEGRRGGKLHEWGIKPGERPDMEFYKRVNKRFQEQALNSLRELAKGDKPFFLNYWPQIPIAVLRSTDDENQTSNGGRWVNAMAVVDGYVGEILDEIKKLGIGDNTIVVLMGDNGPMKQDIPISGYSEWLFRGTKGTALEGGHRVGAFVRWPGVIEPGSIAGDMVFVSDLYTTFARIAGMTDGIPRDRIIDGVDQTALFIKGDTYGRRDYVHLYEVDVLRATVKQQMKIHWPRPGVNPAMAKMYNLYWDPREENPLISQAVWAGTPFVRMRIQHMRMKDKFPDWKPARGMPYEDVENLRPETKEMVQTWLKIYGDAKDVVLGIEAAGN